ncbi:hypothetical protein, variant [Saprolegnia diclina VS20]|uniref:phosphatidylinositol 3-kinase n=1 Tax=Saprolegnia diclina (strain VS20) TaxID=1156394 RepID=T0QMM3_SAPDV|nr:hypothetical protein, variant [Saprolegnia diclina VS20]EQC35065.1 hypothetical protein, variant [Saprolegnia diclina VS20]|eukprot:XP_008611349.1 hypothetical protein, variant [Saprolegnia diclina VS20]
MVIRCTSSTELDVALPSMDELNPYGLAWCGELDSGNNNNDADAGGVETWLPVPSLMHSKESVRFREALSNVLQDMHLEVSPDELEARATTPEYKLEQSDWAAHDVADAFLKTVARLPQELLDDDDDDDEKPSMAPKSDAPVTLGWLKKRGEGNTSMKKRWMQLEGNVIAYYKREVDNAKYTRAERVKLQKGNIELDKISCFQPCGERDLWWAFELVTTNRTWVLQAESEAEYMKWVNALSHTVSFQVVNIVYRRMLCLQEVRATAKTDVRLNLPQAFTVEMAIEHIFHSYEATVDASALRPYTPSDYVLKLTGFKDYLIDPKRRVVDYTYVRECLVTKKMLRLSVVPKASLTLTPSHKRVLSNIKSSGRLSSMLATSLMAFESPDAHHGSTNNNASETTDDAIPEASTYPSLLAPSCNLKEPLRFCIHRAINCPGFTSSLKRTSHDMSIEKQPLVYADVLVRVELYDGGQRLEDPIESVDTKLQLQTATASASSVGWNVHDYVARWDEPKWYRTKMKIKDLPRTARLVLTLWGAKKDASGKVSANVDERERICSTAINVFDVDGLLVQGDTYNQLLSSVYTLRVGPVPHIIDTTKPYLHLTMAQFPTDVQYRLQDDSTDNQDEGINDDDEASRPTGLVIEKKGWLKKLGQQGSLSKWRKRWFSLSSATGVLSYSDSAQSNTPKLIPLKQATVLICDALKETYTTFAVNKGTRREQRTWGFKLKPFESSRVFLIAADSKQDRDEWMAAIRAVAFEASDNQNEFRDLDDSALSSQRSTITASSVSTDDLKRLDTASIFESPSPSSSSPSSSVAAVLDEIKVLIETDPLVRLNKLQKTVLWAHRHLFAHSFRALPRVLSCVQWTNAADVDEARALMASWAAPRHPAEYLELLDVEFSSDYVRKFAVEKLAAMADTTFSYFIPQLVQALKYESYHASPLALHLIERGLRNPNQIGFDIFWALKVEAENDRFRERFGTLLNSFIDVSSAKMRDVLFVQSTLFSPSGALEGICQYVKQLKAGRKNLDEIRAEARSKLTALNESLPTSYQLPIDPRVEVGKLIVSKCKVMSSAKLPLYLVFENAEAGGDPITVIFKSGDDVRQDSLTLQLIRVMDELWRERGLDLAMEPYKCVATGPMTGILQVVLNSITTADIHKRIGTLGAFDETSFTNWITANNQDKKSLKTAVDLFRRSCAGYCVATCVLGIGDRHNDNIMLTHAGRYFHIDFGHFLGHVKYQVATTERLSGSELWF